MQRGSPANASWASRDDNAGFFTLVSIAGLAALAYLLWVQYHAIISAGVIAATHAEIGAIRHFTNRYDHADQQMLASDPAAVTLRDLYGITHAIGIFVRVPACALMLLLAVICFARAAPSRFRRAFDLDSLVAEQAASFTAVSAFVKRRLRLVPLRADVTAPADCALSPGEWLATHATNPKDNSFDAVGARRALIAQLGPPWSGLGWATPQARCLFAAFALHLAGQRTAALALLGRLSAALGGRDEEAGPDEDKGRGPKAPLVLPASAVVAADAVLHDQAVVMPALAIMDRHAYTHTALMSLLNEARRKAGVLSPAQFAWLKLVDRPLWYALHSLGFESEGTGRYLHPNPCVEAAGARDHWAAEIMLGGRRREPSLGRAIEALRRLHLQAEQAGVRRTRETP